MCCVEPILNFFAALKKMALFCLGVADSNIKTLLPIMNANCETLLLFSLQGPRSPPVFLWKPGNPGRSHRSHPSGDVCLRWISPAVALLAMKRWVKRVLLHLVSPGIISVILWEEGQRSLHQTPGPKQWGCSAWTAPRRSHLPQREWSPFVSYCGMRRQIDEGPLIPSGSALRQQAKATVPTHHLAVCLPHWVVMWLTRESSWGGTGQGKCPEEMMSWHPWSLRGRANKKDWGKKTNQKKSSSMFSCLRVWELDFSSSALQGQIVIVRRPLTLSAGVWVCLAFVEKGRCRSCCRVGVWGLKEGQMLWAQCPPPPQSPPRGKCAAIDGRGQGERGGVCDTARTTGPLWFPWRPRLHH